MPDSSQPQSLSGIAVLGCAVFEKELQALALNPGRVVESCFLEIGLHDQPPVLRQRLQAELDRLDARNDIEAIVLAYGLCGRGTDGLRAGRHPLVIARGHDCMTHFMGSKERYAAHQAEHPESYFYTPGWNRARRVPGPDRLAWLREDLSRRFDPDDVDFLIEQEKACWSTRNKAVYLELGTEDAEVEADYAKRCADWLGWSFERMPRDVSLFRDLILGPWDEARFQIVRPGQSLRFDCGPQIFKTGDGV